MIPEISATFFNDVSIDFLLPYSFEEALAPPIPNPKPHFGLMSITETTNAIQLRMRRTTNSVFMCL